MFKKYFLFIATVVVMLIYSIGVKDIYDNSNIYNNVTESAKAEVIYRDNIKGVEQPYPFLTSDIDINNDLEQYSHNNDKGKYIYDNINRLPFTQQKMLANNKDITEYIVGYLNNERVNFEYGETVTLRRKYPYYIQWDRRWAHDSLGNDDIAVGGCGPTSVAMAFSGLLNDETITPNVIAKIENEAGYYTKYGTSWSFFDYIANYYNIKTKRLTLNKDSLDKSLNSGNPVIMSVNPGKFTTVGHIVLIVGIDDNGQYIINDPNSLGKSLKSWTYEELREDMKALWEFSK
ncbi:C39 family peptidase [Gemella sp. GH3]|uniref:C39 family peptidase n=1 Tax=unclassified Gemella TaxID=2624949 RepID=UPI0015D0B7C2|nr:MULTISPECIES: C39 family peptidase [unclassified Gemella]MBF0714281.1 C39 family peptidase [Gemella sp. GH3.1]NYS51233.1 C39 family peptidase [Gemella sp. GH3]